jgi:uncharacterized protein (DUF697 family)
MIVSVETQPSDSPPRFKEYSMTNVDTTAPAPTAVDLRDIEADAVISKHMKWAAGLSIVPVPMLDTMLSELATVYGVNFSAGVARTLVMSLVSGLGTGLLGATLGSALAKLIPGPGMVVGAASMATVAAATTFAIGTIFKMHFSAGGTLLSFDPVKVRVYFSELYKSKQSSVSPVTPAASATPATPAARV